MLEAFRTYHTTAELSATTDPNLVFDLRAKLDAGGHYDDFEVDRVVEVALLPTSKQSELVAALDPVMDRLVKRYKAAQEALAIANERANAKAIEDAKGEMDALVLFKGDMATLSVSAKKSDEDTDDAQEEEKGEEQDEAQEEAVA